MGFQFVIDLSTRLIQSLKDRSSYFRALDKTKDDNLVFTISLLIVSLGGFGICIAILLFMRFFFFQSFDKFLLGLILAYTDAPANSSAELLGFSILKFVSILPILTIILLFGVARISFKLENLSLGFFFRLLKRRKRARYNQLQDARFEVHRLDEGIVRRQNHEVLQSEIVSENLLTQRGNSSLSLAIWIGLLGLCPYFLSHDRFSAALMISIAISIAVHRLASIYRVTNGLFGNNADEALELLHFIIEETQKNGRPPGSRPFNPRRTQKVEIEEVIFGARGAIR